MNHITHLSHITALLQRSQQPYRQGHPLMRRLVTFGIMMPAVFSTTVNASSFSLVGAPATVTVGESFEVKVVGSLPFEPLLAGGLIFEFDPNKVSVDDVVNDIPFGDGPDLTNPSFTCTSACHGLNDPANSIQLAWGSWDGISLANTQMATLTLTALEEGDVSLGLFEDEWSPMVSLTTFVRIPDVQVSGADVQIVPVPAAIWLFGSGLLGLIGLSRRQA